MILVFNYAGKILQNTQQYCNVALTVKRVQTSSIVVVIRGMLLCARGRNFRDVQYTLLRKVRVMYT